MINLMLRTSATEIYNFQDDTRSITKLKVEDISPYNIINDVFDFEIGDLVIVLWAGSVTNPKNILTISSASRLLINSSAVKINRVFIFTEDLYFLGKGTAEEIVFIKKLVEYMKWDVYQIYHCERNVDKLNTLGLKINYFDWYVSSCINIYDQHLNSEPISTNFRKRICCLNRRFDEHRYLACAVLSNYHNVYYSQQYSLEDTKMYQLNISALTDSIKSKVILGLENLKNKTILIDRSMPVDLVDTFEYFSDTAIHDLNFKTKDAFCSIVTESRFYTDFPNFSEKTLRVIYSGRPFLLLAPPGTLKLLQQLGIKTFSDFWDESYDNIRDHTQRFQRVMEIAVEILSKENPSIEPFIPVLEHNRQQLTAMPGRMLELNL